MSLFAVPGWQWLLPSLLALRVVGSLLVGTYFNPDEYWQGPEVAHRMVFGYGFKTWEWQPEAMLRGYTHPLLFACLYKVLAVLGLDTPWACHFGPRMLQGSLVVVQDLAVYRLTRRLFGTRAAQFALLCHVGAWFVAYCSARTFSNSLEAVLMTLVLAYWPLRPLHIRQGMTVQPVEPDSDVAEGSYAPATMTWCLLGAAVTVVIRPSSALFWLFLGLRLLWHSSQPIRFLVLRVLPVGAAVVAAGAAVDRWGYGQWTLVPWNFVQFNLLRGQSALYGTHPWHWYATQGFPTITTTALPLILGGMYHTQPGWSRHLAWLLVWGIAALSLSAHKEFRFVLPLLPAVLPYAGRCLQVWQAWASTRTGIAKRGWQLYIGFSLLVNGAMVVYLGRFHQRGPVAAMEGVASQAQEATARGQDMSLHFWMPCHSTPYYSVMHQPIDMRILDCAPRGRLSPNGSESDQFSKDPAGFLEAWYGGGGSGGSGQPTVAPFDDGITTRQLDTLPTHAMAFDTSLRGLQPFMSRHAYTECGRWSHGFFKGDADASEDPNYVVLLCKQVQ